MSRGLAGRIGRWARIVLPFVVSIVFIVWVLSDVDLAGVWASLTPRALAWFLPGLVAFVFITLYIEAVCLVVVIRDYHGEITLWNAAKMKAASYLLGILNYALGAGAVALLLRRRTSLSLSDAGGIVLLIGLFDLGSLLAAAALGPLILGATGTGVRVAGVVAAVGAIVLGFVVLRLARPLGPLDRLRDLEIFRAARTVSARCLASLAALRATFISSFILLSWTTMNAFEVFVPWVELVVKVAIMLLVAAIPMAVAGLGTGQKVFVELFRDHAPAETLLAASLTLSFGLIVSRAIMGLVFAREYTREALEASRAVSEDGDEAFEAEEKESPGR